MKNVLVLSFAVSPYRGTEYAVGWNFIVNMSKVNKLFVLYAHEICKNDIEHFLSKEQLENVEFFYCGTNKNKRKNVNILVDFYSFYQESKKLHKRALKIAEQLVRERSIDCVHYLNPIGFKEPGYLWMLNKPYVWGPVQGVANWPIACCRILSFRGWFEYLCRMLFHNLQLYLNLRVRRAFLRADVVVAATKDSKRQIDRVFKIKSLFRPENALLRVEASTPIFFEKGERLRLFFAGTLNDRKGLMLFLCALAGFVRKRHVELHVCGDGPLLNSLKKFCLRKHLDDIVIWYGNQPREYVQNLFRTMHLLIIPSLSEATTTVLFEAMSKGVPILSLNHCGMGSVLNEDVAFLIKIGSFYQIVNDITNSLNLILDEPAIIERKSKAMLDLAPKYLWDNQISFFEFCYNCAIKAFRTKENV